MQYIQIQNLVKNYYNKAVETKVLRDINLEIPKGQFLAITGPSGAGKSTLLYQISLLDKPTSGRIFIDGQEITAFGQKESTDFRLSEYGFIFQDYALVPELTAVENVMVPSLMRGYAFYDAKKEAEEVLAFLEMRHATNKLPSQLSGGEQQRVSVARAVARKPKILFADEPTANLDSKRSCEVLEVLVKLNEQGQTIVMVTHETEYANVAHRIIELVDGQIVADKKVPEQARCLEKEVIEEKIVENK